MAKDLNDKVLYESTHDIQDIYRSREEAADYGRSLRDKTPRVSHAGWKAPAERQTLFLYAMEECFSLRLCFSMAQRKLWRRIFLQRQPQVCMYRHAAIATS